MGILVDLNLCILTLPILPRGVALCPRWRWGRFRRPDDGVLRCGGFAPAVRRWSANRGRCQTRTLRGTSIGSLLVVDREVIDGRLRRDGGGSGGAWKKYEILALWYLFGQMNQYDSFSVKIGLGETEKYLVSQSVFSSERQELAILQSRHHPYFFPHCWHLNYHYFVSHM